MNTVLTTEGFGSCREHHRLPWLSQVGLWSDHFDFHSYLFRHGSLGTERHRSAWRPVAQKGLL